MEKKIDGIFCKSYNQKSKSCRSYYKQTDLSLRNKNKRKIKNHQLLEVSTILGCDLPLFIRCCIILSICSGSMIKATMLISDPHFLQIRGFIPYTLFIRRAQADLLAHPFTSWLC